MSRIESTRLLDIEIGRRLRSARMQAGLSMETLAERLGISYQQIQKYERGTNRVASSTLIPISRELGTTPAQLLEGLGESSEPSLTCITDRHALECARMVMSMPLNARASTLRTLHAIAKAFQPAEAAE
ncbi:helix-turn-helix transcriptional regulator [Ancylobacter sonchi]|uniref:helix-turn-helix domain-containing protein n=1 Tax=Ancylobacter sonchi TaxID=1937790 RepID=UPI001BD5D3A1|nr:helix-turn-helix transcriptional regulator [Ancylobacter sonchi]MBS7532090.1 helix-turn-helix transcriptional regulator [Ancylobacter sonchi]